MRAHLVTITIDPLYDTPYVFASFARRFGADPAVWTFATGTPANVRALMASFGVTASRARNGIPESHSSFVYILDRRVVIAKTLLLSTTVVDDAERAISARSHARVAGRS
ncbi:MAG: hypothetical protein NVS3B17_23110 [Vulcanimicrobiaceae bacterium]